MFQPIVDLESSEVVGYEALTRFDSGQRPDLCFADAWSVGLGPELELATLAAAVDAGKRLAPGAWLDLNVSPRLLADPERLRPILWAAERPIVLEVTEHEIIDDYGAVRDAIRALGPDVRLAVDDAGAGVANFGHIIDLRPDFVKLDISLVRRVNAEPGTPGHGRRHAPLLAHRGLPPDRRRASRPPRRPARSPPSASSSARDTSSGTPNPSRGGRQRIARPLRTTDDPDRPATRPGQRIGAAARKAVWLVSGHGWPGDTGTHTIRCRRTVCLCPCATRRPSRICRDCERDHHPGDRRG